MYLINFKLLEIFESYFSYYYFVFADVKYVTKTLTKFHGREKLQQTVILVNWQLMKAIYLIPNANSQQKVSLLHLLFDLTYV